MPTCDLLHIRRSRTVDEVETNTTTNGMSSDGNFLEDADGSASMSGHPLSLLDATNLFPGIPPHLVRFATWAFGPDGLPDLRILAYGDFSHQGRYGTHTILLCKNQATTLQADGFVSHWTFRLLTRDDQYLQELVQRNMGMLGACAVDSILW